MPTDYEQTDTRDEIAEGTAVPPPGAGLSDAGIDSIQGPLETPEESDLPQEPQRVPAEPSDLPQETEVEPEEPSAPPETETEEPAEAPREPIEAPAGPPEAETEVPEEPAEVSEEIPEVPEESPEESTGPLEVPREPQVSEELPEPPPEVPEGKSEVPEETPEAPTESGESEPEVSEEPSGVPSDLSGVEPGMPSEPLEMPDEPSMAPEEPGVTQGPADASEVRIIGDPERDARYWHFQQLGNTCAIVSQEGIINKLTGQNLGEEALMEQAYENGWYTPRGTTPSDVGKLLEAHGVPIIRWSETDMGTIRDELEKGHDVIAGVNPGHLWQDPFCIDKGHAVWVTGIEVDRAGCVDGVFLNDSGKPDDGGDRVSAEVFATAWNLMGNFMISAERPTSINASVGGA